MTNREEVNQMIREQLEATRERLEGLVAENPDGFPGSGYVTNAADELIRAERALREAVEHAVHQAEVAAAGPGEAMHTGSSNADDEPDVDEELEETPPEGEPEEE
jgi:hypothetical protein